MNDIDLARYREKMAAGLAQLEAEDRLGAEARKTVELDQQSVGRLSRMDALQGQAMAKATQARRSAVRARIAAALLRMTEGEYGYCSSCGEEIPRKRLDLDPTIATCVTCART